MKLYRSETEIKMKAEFQIGLEHVVVVIPKNSFMHMNYVICICICIYNILHDIYYY